MTQKIRFLILLILFSLFRVEAEAILDQDRKYFTVTDLSASQVITVNINNKKNPVSTKDQSETVIPVSTHTTSEVDMSKDPEYSGSLLNTRFTNVSDLEKVVDIILRFKKENPSSNHWAAFDVDETLIDRRDPSKPIHPQTNELFQRLKTNGITILLLTMSSPPKPKFERAKLTYEGVINKGLLSRDKRGVFIPKGKRLQQYIKTLPGILHPSHVFFADDQLFSDQGVINVIGNIAVYIESVEATMREMKIPFTTFHFQKKHL